MILASFIHKQCLKVLLGGSLITLSLTSLDTFAASLVFVNGQSDGDSTQVVADLNSILCRTGNSPVGLEKTRKVLGLANCNDNSPQPSELLDEIDLVVLVDDRRGVSSDLNDRIDSVDGEVLTCSSSGPRRRVYPSYFSMSNESSGLRVLIVGEEMIKTYFSDTNDDEPWFRHLQKIILQAQGVGASADSGEFSPSISTDAANGIPAGKGLFQNRPLNRLVNNRYRPYKMDHMASRFRDNDINWFALSAPVAEKCEGKLYNQYLRFGKPNFQTFIWMLNHADNIESQIDQMIRAVRNTRASGIIIDIEGQAFSRHRDEARELYRVAREKANEFSRSQQGWPITVGITVIGFPNTAPYVNEDDLNSADFIMPQIYNRADKLSNNNLNRRLTHWTTAFTGKPVIPLAGAHHCAPITGEMGCNSERAKSPEEFETSISPFRNYPLSSIGWWRYGSVENGDHWGRIRSFSLNTRNNLIDPENNEVD